MAEISKLFLRFDMHFLPLYYGLFLQREDVSWITLYLLSYIKIKIMQSVFFAFLMAVPYETPIETLSDVVLKTDQAHFCGSMKQRLRPFIHTTILL